MTTYNKLPWRVNTGGLLKEVLNNPGTAALVRPIQIFASILHEVGARASELNDYKLNTLMARLAIYAETDPYSGEYNEEITHELLKDDYPEYSVVDHCNKHC